MQDTSSKPTDKEWQDNFLDYPDYMWNESDARYRNFRTQMRARWRKLTAQVERNKQAKKEA